MVFQSQWRQKHSLQIAEQTFVRPYVGHGLTIYVAKA